MKLGDDTIGLRKSIPRLDGNGRPVRDEYGDDVVDVVDVEVPWCLVTPSQRTSDTTEPESRSAPALTGYDVLAPPGTDAEFVDVVVWPITGRTGTAQTNNLALAGRTWQVVGEPLIWQESVELRLRAST
ncbi:MAG: hypothetical protein HOQ45_20315 [Nocardioidaceae bacterium]|nr:hypothetical protein [Nocardioidaceae bacterium]